MNELTKLINSFTKPEPIGHIYEHKQWLIKFDIGNHTFQKEYIYKTDKHLSRTYDKNEIIELAKSLKQKNTQIALKTTTIERII